MSPLIDSLYPAGIAALPRMEHPCPVVQALKLTTYLVRFKIRTDVVGVCILFVSGAMQGSYRI